MSNMSKELKLVNALRKGNILTANQIKTRFKLANPYAAIASVRDRHGITVNKNVINRNGVRTVKYSVNNNANRTRKTA
jgi:hypothetical protein